MELHGKVRSDVIRLIDEPLYAMACIGNEMYNYNNECNSIGKTGMYCTNHEKNATTLKEVNKQACTNDEHVEDDCKMPAKYKPDPVLSIDDHVEDDRKMPAEYKPNVILSNDNAQITTTFTMKTSDNDYNGIDMDFTKAKVNRFWECSLCSNVPYKKQSKHSVIFSELAPRRNDELVFSHWTLCNRQQSSSVVEQGKELLIGVLEFLNELSKVLPSTLLVLKRLLDVEDKLCANNDTEINNEGDATTEQYITEDNDLLYINDKITFSVTDYNIYMLSQWKKKSYSGKEDQVGKYIYPIIYPGVTCIRCGKSHFFESFYIFNKYDLSCMRKHLKDNCINLPLAKLRDIKK